MYSSLTLYFHIFPNWSCVYVFLMDREKESQQFWPDPPGSSDICRLPEPLHCKHTSDQAINNIPNTGETADLSLLLGIFTGIKEALVCCPGLLHQSVLVELSLHLPGWEHVRTEGSCRHVLLPANNEKKTVYLGSVFLSTSVLIWVIDLLTNK